MYVGKYGVENDDSGLYYMRARYYNPKVQRFVNVDPIRDRLNWYIYADSNVIGKIDPTGKTSIKQFICEILSAFEQGISIRDMPLLKKESDWARDIGKSYAELKGFKSSNGDLVTWENEADAVRHFYWNARMTKELGIDVAETIANNHKTITWKIEDQVILRNGIINKVSLASLMDLYNNESGRKYANEYPDLNYETLYLNAKNNGDVITDLSEVQRKYGLEDQQIFNKNNGLANAYVYGFYNDEGVVEYLNIDRYNSLMKKYESYKI